MFRTLVRRAAQQTRNPPVSQVEDELEVGDLDTKHEDVAVSEPYMGVTGLWTIVQPCARPTPLPALNRKRLAVDASIWIYQFLKAVRDKEGNALRNTNDVRFFNDQYGTA
ncbi:DNA repair protein rad2 [Ciborinia camelliae]|nr:DNA repair protein rad2 [Ciborinia camelliae]